MQYTIKVREDKLFKKEYFVQRRDSDMNNHVHNLSYLDMSYEILPQDIYKNKIFDIVRIVYKKEIVYGENIKCYYSEYADKYIIIVKKVKKK